MRNIQIIEFFEDQFGPNMIMDDEVDIDDDNNRVYFTITSHSKSAFCPICKCESTRKHGNFMRTIRCGNFEGKEIVTRVKANRFKCSSDNCVQTFREQLSFVQPYRQFSNEVRMRALSCAINMNYSQCERTFKQSGEHMSRKTFQRLVDETNRETIHTTILGIDDVSSHKNNEYRTVIYDYFSRRVVKVFDGRDGKGIKQYIHENHPDCLVITRDRSTAFASGVSAAIPNCLQIADKYHIFDNFIELTKSFLIANTPSVIYIDRNGEILDIPPEPIWVLKEPDMAVLQQLHFDNSPVELEDGSLGTFDLRLRDRNSKAYVERNRKHLEKQKLAIAIRQYCSGEGDYPFPRETKYTAIARLFSTTPYLVKHFLSMTEDEVCSMTEIKEQNRCYKSPPYMNIIVKMLIKDIPPSDIFYYIKYIIGTDVPDNILAKHIDYVISNNFPQKPRFNIRYLLVQKLPDGIICVSRNRLSRFLFTKKPKKKDEELEKHIDILKERYQAVEIVSQAYNEFYSIFQGNDPSKLQTFIDKYKETYLQSFCNGLRRDIEAVRNALVYNTLKGPDGKIIQQGLNSGYVEGLNLLYKLILREAYGRLTTESIDNKLALATAQRCEGFSLRELVTGDRILRADIGRNDHPSPFAEFALA